MPHLNSCFKGILLKLSVFYRCHDEKQTQLFRGGFDEFEVFIRGSRDLLEIYVYRCLHNLR